MKGDLDLIKSQLQERIGDVCRKLLPHGRDEGGQWVSFNPVTGDKAKHHNPALKVRLRGGVAGAWKDWRSGDKGDVLGLVAYLLATDAKGALVWARDFLGLRDMTRADRETMRRVVATRKVAQEKDDAARRARKLLDADRLFRAGGGDKPIGPALVPLGTFEYADAAHVKHAAQLHAEAYFSARGVALHHVAALNRYSFRFSPQTEWWRGATYGGDGEGHRFKAEPGPLFPAVHAAMRNQMGIVTACHLTFLDPLKPGKAPVEQAKLMYGEAKGAVIEISTGPAQKPFWMDDGHEQHPVVLAEGIETALAFAISGVPARVWACGSLAGIGAAPVGLPFISWVLFARDNNDGNAQAQRQFAAALDQLEQSGKTIRVEASHVGDDFNDLATGEE